MGRGIHGRGVRWGMLFLLAAAGVRADGPPASEPPSTLHLTRPQRSPARVYDQRIHLRPEWTFVLPEQEKNRPRSSVPPGAVPPEQSGSGPGMAPAADLTSRRVVAPRDPEAEATRNWILPPPPPGTDPAKHRDLLRRWGMPPAAESTGHSGAAVWRDLLSPDRVAAPAPDLQADDARAGDSPVDLPPEDALEDLVNDALRHRLTHDHRAFGPVIAGAVLAPPDGGAAALQSALDSGDPGAGPKDPAAPSGLAPPAPPPEGVAPHELTLAREALQSLSPSSRGSPGGTPVRRRGGIRGPAGVEDASWRDVFRGLADSLASAGRSSSSAAPDLPPAPPPGMPPATMSTGSRLTSSSGPAAGDPSPMFPAASGPAQAAPEPASTFGAPFDPVGAAAVKPRRPEAWSSLAPPSSLGSSADRQPGSLSAWTPFSEDVAASSIRPPPDAPGAARTGLDSFSIPELQPDKRVNLDLNPRRLRPLLP